MVFMTKDCINILLLSITGFKKGVISQNSSIDHLTLLPSCFALLVTKLEQLNSTINKTICIALHNLSNRIFVCGILHIWKVIVTVMRLPPSLLTALLEYTDTIHGWQQCRALFCFYVLEIIKVLCSSYVDHSYDTLVGFFLFSIVLVSRFYISSFCWVAFTK